MTLQAFLKNSIIRYAVYSKFATFALFEKKTCFLKKHQILYMLEKSYYFSRILRQFCYDLVKFSKSELSAPSDISN